MYCFYCITWRCISIFCLYLLIFTFSDLFAILFWSFHLNISQRFSFLSIFAFRHNFFCTGSLGTHQFYPRLISLLHELALSIQWCPLGYLVIVCLSFDFYLDFFLSQFLRDGNVVVFSAMNFSLLTLFCLFAFTFILWYWGALCFDFHCFALFFRYLAFRFG